MFMKLKLRRRICRLINSVHTYDYVDSQGGWTKAIKPITGMKKNTAYFDPYIYQYSNDLWMYVSNRNTNCVEKYISKDGFDWEYSGISLERGRKGSWDERVNRACVFLKDSVYYMWFTGQCVRGSQIGLAISHDGIFFTRVQDDAVICPEKSFEKKNVMNPCVIWDEEKQIYKMWYSAGDQYEPDCICYAESTNGILWNKRNEPVLTKSFHKYDCYKVGGCDVHYSNGRYIMFYIGYQDTDNARICVAYSEDGLNWIREDNNPIVSPSKNSWDANAVYKPSAIYHGNKVYLYYNGRKNEFETIGLAINNTGGFK